MPIWSRRPRRGRSPPEGREIGSRPGIRERIAAARGRLARILFRTKGRERRADIVAAIAKLALAESSLDAVPEGKRPTAASPYPKGSYSKARSAADLARKVAKEARSSLIGGECLSLEETVALSEMAAALSVASVGASQIAKRLYALEFDGDGGDSIYDSSKWKGRYIVALYDEDDEPLFFDGPRDMAESFGITVKSAVDRLSSAFPGKEGEGKKQLVINGRKYSVHFVLNDE